MNTRRISAMELITIMGLITIVIVITPLILAAANNTTREKIIAFTGDSITDGIMSEWKGLLGSFPRFLISISDEPNELLWGYKILNVAEGGASFGKVPNLFSHTGYFPLIPEQIEKAIRLNPDILVVWGGTNDITAQLLDLQSKTLEENWNDVVEQIKKSSIKNVIFVTHYEPYPSDTFDQLKNDPGVIKAQRMRRHFNELIIKTCESNERFHVFRADQIVSPGGSAPRAILSRDYVHLSFIGHALIAAEMLKLFEEIIPDLVYVEPWWLDDTVTTYALAKEIFSSRHTL